MKERDYSYDSLRAFSAIMIVLCHICQGFGLSVELGYYLSGTYVNVFLLLSAYLFGLSNRDKIRKHYGSFLKKRIARLIPSYYLFLIFVIAFIGIFIGMHYLNLKQIMGHFLFLNWLWPASRIYDYPLPQIGHLWFMSAILVGYISVVVWAVILNWVPTMDKSRYYKIFVIVSVALSSCLTYKSHMMIYPCSAILFFILIFYKGKEMMDSIRKLPNWMLVSLLIMCNLGGG